MEKNEGVSKENKKIKQMQSTPFSTPTAVKTNKTHKKELNGKLETFIQCACVVYLVRTVQRFSAAEMYHFCFLSPFLSGLVWLYKV